MKPIRLLLTALSATSLVSCSTSEDIPATPELQQIDTYLSVAAGASGIRMKAEEGGRGNENFINRLTALVFYDDGRLAAVKDTSVQWDKGESASIDKITNIKVKVSAMETGEGSATPLKVVLVANTDVAAIAGYTDLATKTFGDISTLVASTIYRGTPSKEATYLPMSSKEISINGSSTKVVAGAQNWIDDDGTVDGKQSATRAVTMYRHVARIELESLKSAFTDNNLNLRFRLDSVALANVSSNSLYMSDGDGDLHQAKARLFRGMPRQLNRKDYYIADGASDTYKPGALSVTTGFGNAVSNLSPAVFTTVPMLYAFEYSGKKETLSGATERQGEISTLMILAGKFVNADGSEDRTYIGTRYFRIPIKMSETDATYGVARNTVYRIQATLTGEGTKNPDENMLNAMINFSITVKNWQQVTQTEEDVN